jgi:hypothetical protein
MVFIWISPVHHFLTELYWEARRPITNELTGFDEVHGRGHFSCSNFSTVSYVYNEVILFLYAVPITCLST